MNLIPSHSRGTRQTTLLAFDSLKTRSPEMLLAWNVFEQALCDATQQRGSSNKHRQLIQRQAIEWFELTDYSWPFSAINLCETFGLSISRIRAYLSKAHPPKRRNTMARLTSTGPQVGDVSLKILDKPASEYTLEEVREITERMRGARVLIATAKREARPKGIATKTEKPKPTFDPTKIG